MKRVLKARKSSHIKKRRSGKWFKPKVHSGWRKDMPTNTRRAKALKAHKGNALSTARSLQALANVTMDEQTKGTAQSDANYFFKKHRNSSK